jgi:hypothetical protein
MKKFIIAAVALVFTTGILASQTKVNNTKTVTTITVPNNISIDRKDLASAD